MIISLALGMVLLLALYLTLSTNVFWSQAGRDAMNEGALARVILKRIASDISGHLPAFDPRQDAVVATGAAASSSSSSGTTTPMTDTSNTVYFNTSVVGDSSSVTLSVYRVRRPGGNSAANEPDNVITSDVRRICLWYVGNATDANSGLARAEIGQATSLDSDTLPNALPDQEKSIFAPEVKSVMFEYYDGSSWQNDWDGTVAGDDIGTPIGPPAAIGVTMTLRRRLDSYLSMMDDPNADGAVYQQIIALPTANTFPPRTPNQ